MSVHHSHRQPWVQHIIKQLRLHPFKRMARTVSGVMALLLSSASDLLNFYAYIQSHPPLVVPALLVPVSVPHWVHCCHFTLKQLSGCGRLASRCLASMRACGYYYVVIKYIYIYLLKGIKKKQQSTEYRDRTVGRWGHAVSLSVLLMVLCKCWKGDSVNSERVGEK